MLLLDDNLLPDCWILYLRNTYVFQQDGALLLLVGAHMLSWRSPLQSLSRARRRSTSSPHFNLIIPFGTPTKRVTSDKWGTSLNSRSWRTVLLHFWRRYLWRKSTEAFQCGKTVMLGGWGGWSAHCICLKISHLWSLIMHFSTCSFVFSITHTIQNRFL